MHTVIRSYSGSGATALFDLLEEKKKRWKALFVQLTGLYPIHLCALQMAVSR